MENAKILIYKAPDGQAGVDVRLDEDTVWLTQTQIIDLFQSSKANISEHIKHIFKSGELHAEATVRKFRTVRKDGKEFKNHSFSDENKRITAFLFVGSWKRIIFYTGRMVQNE